MDRSQAKRFSIRDFKVFWREYDQMPACGDVKMSPRLRDIFDRYALVGAFRVDEDTGEIWRFPSA